MQITSKLTIAIHIIIGIDYFQDSETVTSNFLAGSVGANPVIVRGIMGKLKEAGMIRSSQGKSGISLAKGLEEISFYDIYKAVDCVDSEEGLFHFHENPNMSCPVGRNIHRALDKKLEVVQQVMENELRKLKVADVAQDVRNAIQEDVSQADQEKKLDFLVERFKEDSGEYRDLQTPPDREGKRRILRSLMNIRLPHEMPADVLKIQDEYLQECAREKGVVTLADIPTVGEAGILSIWQGDITRLACDAIVNAANSQMLGCFVPMHTCIDNCIHTYAGIQLRAECDRQMQKLRMRYGRNYEQPTAVPMLTDAYNLPARKVIHIVGPIVQGKLTAALEKELADCYRNTLDLCLENGLKSVAFCCISTGVFHFPNRRAAEIAVETVEAWLVEHAGCMERVIFNVFKDEDRAYYEELLEN